MVAENLNSGIHNFRLELGTVLVNIQQNFNTFLESK